MATQCWVTMQHCWGSHPEIKPELSALFYVIWWPPPPCPSGPDDPQRCYSQPLGRHAQSMTMRVTVAWCAPCRM